MRRRFIALLMLVSLLGPSAHVAAQEAAPSPPHNIIIFVADGLRGRIVDTNTAPTLAALRDEGAYFPNSHSVFPTFTTANASTIATGHQLGDTGDFSNSIYVKSKVASAKGSSIPFLEDDLVLGEVDRLFGGDYLDEETLLNAAKTAGFSTAAIGKLGPALIQDHEARDGVTTVVIDDSTGSPRAIPLSPEMQAGLTREGLPLATPSRGANGDSGTATRPGTVVPNKQQQDYFVAAATRVVLPIFAARRQPFAMVFWSRDPDGTQHNQGDSLNQLTPGINGPSTMAAIRNVDDDLRQLRETLTRLGLADTTDIFVTSDHGFSVIAKDGSASGSAKTSYPDVPAGFLPPGFLALDLARAFNLPVFDPDNGYARVAAGAHPSHGNGLIGTDPDHPSVIVAANGGSDLIYLPTRDRRRARQLVAILSRQDYVSGLFVDDAFGKIAGTLPLSAINLKGKAVTPTPSIVVNFRTFSTGCAIATNCQAEIADTTLQQGQGMHGSFGRGDTLNFMAAVGPDFKAGFVDPAPAGNPDITPTLAAIIGVRLRSAGSLQGRPLGEALRGSSGPPDIERRTLTSRAGANGRRTILRTQTVAGVRYLDAAGYGGRTLGLEEPSQAGK